MSGAPIEVGKSHRDGWTPTKNIKRVDNVPEPEVTSQGTVSDLQSKFGGSKRSFAGSAFMRQQHAAIPSPPSKSKPASKQATLPPIPPLETPASVYGVLRGSLCLPEATPPTAQVAAAMMAASKMAANVEARSGRDEDTSLRVAAAIAREAMAMALTTTEAPAPPVDYGVMRGRFSLPEARLFTAANASVVVMCEEAAMREKMMASLAKEVAKEAAAEAMAASAGSDAMREKMMASLTREVAKEAAAAVAAAPAASHKEPPNLCQALAGSLGRCMNGQ